MKNNKKEDDLSINIISAPNEIVQKSQFPVGNAETDGFCLYAGMRHAVGSVITKDNGAKIICTEDGSWQNKNS